MVPNFTSFSLSINSPFGKHMGEEPSQQPPLWWNMSSPWRSLSWSMIFMALSETNTRFINCSILEKAQFVLVIRNQHVLGLSVMVEHHFMGFPSDT